MHPHYLRRSDDAAPAQQPDATAIIIADDPSASAAATPATQQAQHWLGSINDLVSYVESKAQHAGLQAQQAHHSNVHAQLLQLQAQLQQQAAQLHSQTQELKVLRALQPSSGSPNGSRGGQLYQELQRRQQEADAWRSKYQLQLQCRDVAESALKETLVVVDQLSEDCAAICGMLGNLQVLEAAAAAAAAAEAGSSTNRKVAAWWLAAEVGMALLLVVCTGLATFLITRTVLLHGSCALATMLSFSKQHSCDVWSQSGILQMQLPVKLHA